MNKELSNITKQSSIVFLGKIIGLMMALIFNFIAARFLGAEIYGEFTYIYTFLSFFPILILLGLEQGLVYFIPKLTEKKQYEIRNKFITISFYLIIMVSVISILIIFLNSEFIAEKFLNNTELSFLLQILAPIVLLLAINKLFQGVFRGFKQIKHIVISTNLIIPLLKILCIIPLILLIGTITSLVVATYISVLVGFLYFVYYLKKLDVFTKINKKNIYQYKEVLLYSFPLLFVGSLNFISQNTDIFMIGYFLADDQVGIYRIALQIGTLSSFMLVAFNMIFAPTISALYHRNDMTTLESNFKTITKWIVTVNLAAFSLILLLNNEILMLFGEEFAVGATALVLIAIGQVVNSAVGSSGYILSMTGYPMYMMYINLINVTLNIILNLVFIPTFGIIGAAIASLVTVSIDNLLKLISVYKVHKIHPYNSEYLKVIAASIFTLIFLLLLKQFLVFSWVMTLITYSILFVVLFTSILLKLGLSEDDKDILNSVFSKVKSRMK